MIPTGTTTLSSDITNEIIYKTHSNYTYKLNIESERVASYVDELEAYKQAVYKIINTERYDHLIYSWNYGVELKELFGLPLSYVIPEIEQRITEAVMQDDRTVAVYGFEFEEVKKGILHVTFNCKSTLGTITMSREVSV